MAPADRQTELELGMPRQGGKGALTGVLHAFAMRSFCLFVLMLLPMLSAWRRGLPAVMYGPLVDARFGDLLEYVPTFHAVHTASFFQSSKYPMVAYPPFGCVLFAGLYSVSRPVVLYLSLAALWLSACAWAVRRKLLEHGVRRFAATAFPVIVLGVSFPVLGLLQRGNIELLLWIFAASGLWAYVHGRERTAAGLWGLAAAVKLYPLIFLVLLLRRRSLSSFVLGVASFAFASLASMVYLGPSVGVAFQGSLKNVFGYQAMRAAEIGAHDLGTNHSAFVLLKVFAHAIGRSTDGWTLPYYACGAVLFAVVYFGRLRTMPVANRLLAVSVFMVMFPPVSYFYTLVHLYAAWLVLVFIAVRAERAGVTVRGLSMTILVFVPVFGSYTVLTYPTLHVYGGPVQALLLVWLFVSGVQFPFAEPVAGAQAPVVQESAGLTRELVHA